MAAKRKTLGGQTGVILKNIAGYPPMDLLRKNVDSAMFRLGYIAAKNRYDRQKIEEERQLLKLLAGLLAAQVQAGQQGAGLAGGMPGGGMPPAGGPELPPIPPNLPLPPNVMPGVPLDQGPLLPQGGIPQF